ncbi:MAG: hypothetical protein HF978_06625 [Desulfobacteraceae bacterium]|nr:biopolymer transporter ExbD [Desulfobacteraceae bacterium]MBC2755206.1 hypothetical protein [Desulfobacteraceae bacterium]
MKGFLGADIFINLLLVFIVAFGMLFMNTNDSANSANANGEKMLPKIILPSGQSDGAAMATDETPINLSAEKDGEKTQYFIDDVAVRHDELKGILTNKKADTVKIRFDEHLSYGKYIEMLDLCVQCGIKNISNVYTSAQ